jgi:two-component system, chemotaxis family, chemotaxis protein CheY
MEEKQCANGIAIVDDEKSLVTVYMKLFQMHKLPVCFVAYDGHEAIEEFEKANPKPKIFLLDYRLPGITGVDVAKEILKRQPNTKIIMLSADADAQDAALKAGAISFLKKPVSIKEIIKEVENAYQ